MLFKEANEMDDGTLRARRVNDNTGCDGVGMETKRIAFFAHYDRMSIIDDYVLYYLRGLRKVADRTLFASDCDLERGEAGQLGSLAEPVCIRRHGEYDFGSWKRCFEHLAYDLSGYDELILANDSCYAPITPFEYLFERMQTQECDFWGPTMDATPTKWLNSYFLVFRKPVLADDLFISFWRNICALEAKQDVVDLYEKGLSLILKARGFKMGWAATPRPNFARHRCFPLPGDYRIELPSKGYLLPFARTATFVKNEESVNRLGMQLNLIAELYPRSLIDKHIERLVGTADPSHYHYRATGEWRWKWFRIVSKFKLSKRKRLIGSSPRFIWYKLYVYLFEIPIFVLIWPFKNQIGQSK